MGVMIRDSWYSRYCMYSLLDFLVVRRGFYVFLCTDVRGKDDCSPVLSAEGWGADGAMLLQQGVGEA